MSEIESKVKEIIVEKLGVEESEVTLEASSPTTLVLIHWTPLSSSWSSRRSSVSPFLMIRLRRSLLLATL